MEKQKKWQFFLILAVIALTVYNILPTIFYYSKPLKKPISEKQAGEISLSISKRVNTLQNDSKEWISSFCDLLKLKPLEIKKDGSTFRVRFKKSEEAALFSKYFPRAGALIPFPPAQLQLTGTDETKEVSVLPKVATHLDPSLFSFAPVGSEAFREQILDRAEQIALILAGPSETAFHLAYLDESRLEALALQIDFIAELSEKNKAAANRFAASFTQGPFQDKPAVIQSLINAFDSARDRMKSQPVQERKEALFIRVKNYLKAHQAIFASGQEPLKAEEIREVLKEKSSVAIGQKNPIFSEILIDWENGAILLKPHPDKKHLTQALVNEAAKISRQTNEILQPVNDTYTIAFTNIADCSGFLTINLEKILQDQAEQVISAIKSQWNPSHTDMQAMKIVDLAGFEALSAEEKNLCMIVQTDRQLRLAIHGLDALIRTYDQFPNSEPALAFQKDFRNLLALLEKEGLRGRRTESNDFIFENDHFLPSLLLATRESFEVRGTRKFATLELSNLEQRLLVENRVETKAHEDLIKWQEEYDAAQVNPHVSNTTIPKPTKNLLWNNLALSFSKYFRGDERKALRWGLDLSGGKTVQVELRDHHNQVVTGDEDLKLGINELYSRVNKMGVSEVAIRQLGNQIVLDFPGSQSLSATELIKASSMYFHVVNERFSSPYSPLAPAVQRFLSGVWNEALISGRKDAESVHAIAWSHLHRTQAGETAKILLDNGLVLQKPEEHIKTSETDATTSRIAVLRDAPQDHHPLLIVFSNFALEGSQLDQIQPGYDPQRGNYLHFSVKGTSQGLHAWTSLYAKDCIAGTDLDGFTQGKGWRMAVILNNTVISSPTLESALKDSASISGSFSQREVTQLAADLKAGSLTFTPHILSEKNVSPELGQKERMQGIAATGIALLLVVASMIGYYRYAGFIASIAVLFNLLILWATLQNIGATLSLAGIAGIILTVGMAVDANVLVFERIKEELEVSGKISSAIYAGYQRAYSAIIDSNVTTVIAALILLNFDAGPIKGFAITLIIGIVSSMFTALFMTRYYFVGWLQNPKNRTLNMANWIRASSIPFLSQSKKAFAVAALIIAIGCNILYQQRATVLGMDFTGGYSLYLEAEPGLFDHYVAKAQDALVKQGAHLSDVQVRALTPENHLRILFSPAMELEGRPFYNLGTEPRAKINWIVNALETEGISLKESSKQQLESNWTAMSGQMSDTMRNNAIFGLLIALFFIFVYITFRFEYKYAISAILCVIHDVLITLGAIGIFHAWGVPVQIDLNTVAAIMTIVGYSLNDTIIVFDRIREEARLFPLSPLSSIANSALNTTLSRTTITSGTTFLVLLALVIFGGASVFSFAFVMAIGVLFGTLSSWYIAAPLMLLFHKREESVIVEQL